MAAITLDTAAPVQPQCYAYTIPAAEAPTHQGWTKIGYTERDVETRIEEQLHTAGFSHKTEWHMRAAFIKEPFGDFTDKDFHAYLGKLGVQRNDGTEWFHISPDESENDYLDFIRHVDKSTSKNLDETIPYTLRDEQRRAVEQTARYFRTHEHSGGENSGTNEEVAFLWNAKPRFGKTLTAYDLCRELGAKNILIVTNRPAVASSWYSDYVTFFGPQSGYLFVSHVDGVAGKRFVYTREEYKKKVAHAEPGAIKGCIEFVSLQDMKGSRYLSTSAYGNKLQELGKDGTLWDILIVDEAHEGVDTYLTDAAFSQIQRRWTLYMSGTPFKAMADGRFSQDAIFNWTYTDEQEHKRDWDNANDIENPYAVMPRINLYTYKMSDIVRDKVRQGIELADGGVEEYAFDLNEFFATDSRGRFVHDADVDRFLDALTRQEKFPFSTPQLRDELKHTFWLLDRVASAKALAAKLKDHPVFKDYDIVMVAGDGKVDGDEESGNQEAYTRVTNAIKNAGTDGKTITLSAGRLTTGVTIPEWTGVLMLCNMKSPAQYMQAAFRAQNPCLFPGAKGESPRRKRNCYVFDFDPARTLTIVEKFANDLIPATSGSHGTVEERKHNVRELLNFFPVYGEDDGGSMVELDAEKVLTIPRHIHAKEVVERGFMSNFLFANISGIFNAPQEVIDLIGGMQALEEPKARKPLDLDPGTKDELSLDDEGNVEVSDEKVIGDAADISATRSSRTWMTALPTPPRTSPSRRSAPRTRTRRNSRSCSRSSWPRW